VAGARAGRRGPLLPGAADSGRAQPAGDRAVSRRAASRRAASRRAASRRAASRRAGLALAVALWAALGGCTGGEPECTVPDGVDPDWIGTLRCESDHALLWDQRTDSVFARTLTINWLIDR